MNKWNPLTEQDIQLIENGTKLVNGNGEDISERMLLKQARAYNELVSVLLFDICDPKRLRDTSKLASNPAQNAQVWEIQSHLKSVIDAQLCS